MSQIGIATSIITLIEKSLAAYRSVAAAKNFGSNVGQQVMMLRFETFRYREWTQDNSNITKIFENAKADLEVRREGTVGLVRDGKAVSPATTIHDALCDAVTQVIDILASINKILAKYEPANPGLEQPSVQRTLGLSGLVVDLDGKGSSMAQSHKKFSELKEALQSKTPLLRRVKYGIPTWNDADKEVLKGFLETLKYWNDGLYALAPPSRSSLMELGLSSQLVAAASTQEELRSIQTAASASSYETVSRSASLKEKVNERQGQAIQLDYESVQLDSKVSRSRRLITNYYPCGLPLPSIPVEPAQIEPQRIMVEWYYYDSKWNARQIAIANERVENLAFLFSVPNKPSNLPVLDCIGWIQHPVKNDRGLIYRLPPSQGYDVNGTQQPISLYDVLSRGHSSTDRRPPTLESRFRLASAVAVAFLELHTVDWLHKGFDSNDVFLFPDSDSRLQYRQPFIIGFDFARPDRSGEESLSMRPSKFDIYRHPELRAPRDSETIFEASTSRMHDVYSLGLVLFEIGMWMSLETYLKPNITPDELRARVMGYAARDLPLYMGSRYASAVQACLGGEYQELSQPISFGDDEHEVGDEVGEGVVDGAAESKDCSRVHQLAYFYRHVVAELSRCHCGARE